MFAMRDILQRELERRRRGNARYSIRAFAQFLGTDHATLSQILRGRRRVTPRSVRRFGARLGLDRAVVAKCCRDATDDALLRAIRGRSFRADVRWLAAICNLPIDEVNIALHRLVHSRKVVMAKADEWRVNE